MKPDWKDAPELAEYLAQDKDGRWFWYELEPYIATSDQWREQDFSCVEFAGIESENWQETLQKRPK